MLSTGQMLTGAFVNDNRPPHHWIVRNLGGNYEAGYVTLSFNGDPPAALRVKEKYYLGSDQKNFGSAQYIGYDGRYLRFKVNEFH